jgi:lipoprotein signal peptidase
MNTPAASPRTVFTRRSGVLLALSVAATAFIVDHTTKYAASVPGPVRHLPFVFPIQNNDDLLGIVSGNAYFLSASSMMLVVAVLAIARWRVFATWPIAIATGLAVGGTLGNTIERLATGSVTDFLVVGHIVINLADLCVLAGVLIASVVTASASMQRLRSGTPTESSDTVTGR